MVLSYRRHLEGESGMGSMIANVASVAIMKSHGSHPDFGHLTLLVFEAVLEVVCVALPGYIVARLGGFDADKQRFLANLNVTLFTPCLIFTKLASQLTVEKLSELWVIPFIFTVQTLVSFVCSRLVAKGFGFNKRATNFVVAMGVFGNSNSLPISLVLSLSSTLKGLHWDKIPHDNDNEVAARGILYLMIFQQLGQLVRWSWGYHVLLAPKSSYPEYNNEIAEEGNYRDGDDATGAEETEGLTNHEDDVSSDSERYVPRGRTPVGSGSQTSLHDIPNNVNSNKTNGHHVTDNISTPASREHFAAPASGADGILSFPQIRNTDEETPNRFKVFASRAMNVVRRIRDCLAAWTHRVASGAYNRLPSWAQWTVDFMAKYLGWFSKFLWEFMNPPLWAMLIAILVAVITPLQRLFFEEGTFINNSVTSAVSSSAGVAVPLILVVLGANLARNTQQQDTTDSEEAEIGNKLLIASLVSRMLIPTLIMAPVLALGAKFTTVSIIDDPIFIVVVFLLTGAPSALQLAQICQINFVYEKTMGRILFWSYVVVILPSTLILVLTALEVLEWANPVQT